MKNGYTRTLYKNWRILFNVNNESHTFTVEDIVGNSSKVSISSETQEATLSVGEEKRFELSGDNYYDILVILDSVSLNKATFTIQSIQEMQPENEEKVSDDNESLGNNGIQGSEAINVLLVVGLILLVIIALIFLIYKVFWEDIKRIFKRS